MLELLSTPEIWLSLATLTFLEIVLGVDNVIFVALMAGRLPEAKRASARTLGLAMALVFRIIMLMGLVWMAHLEADLFAVFDHGVSWRDLILLGGGLFLLAKGTLEIHHTVEGVSEAPKNAAGEAFLMIVAQITVIDIVFSLDSVITAVGMTDHVPIMALAFLLLIGMSLIADGLGFHIPRGYLYFAIAFSLFVEVLNILAKKARAGGAPPSGKDAAG